MMMDHDVKQPAERNELRELILALVLMVLLVSTLL
jgi:hypothetical protein